MKRSRLLSEKEFLKGLHGEAKNVFGKKSGKYSEVFKIASIVYATRKKLSLTQESFAKKCGVSKGFISQLENGRHEGIGFRTLDKIMNAVGYTIEIKAKKKAA
jgi:DNA-binding transcriptional regulator YiaG